MRIKLAKKLLDSINDGNLERFDIEMQHMRYGATSLTIEIDDWPVEKVAEFQKIVSSSKAFGAKITAKDLQSWIETLNEEANMEPDEFLQMKCRKVEFFATYLIKYYSRFKQHRIYVSDSERNVMYCCYIYDIEYHPEHKDSYNRVVPEYVDLVLAWEELGEEHTQTYTFYAKDCAHYIKVKDALSRKQLYVPTKAMDRHYEQTIKKFEAIAWNIGEQYLATGAGSDDVESMGNSRSYRWNRSMIDLDKGGEPSNVVIDLFIESDSEENKHSRSKNVDPYWWWRKMEIDGEADEMIEKLPVHPNVVIFALKKQLRLRVHVDQLTKYVYDESMAEKLILPKESANLVRTLINYKGGFQDIVKNKGGGAVVLCTGIPGTGKTLTAEVYSEAMHKPLYSVQCSQLGIDSENLEKYLLITFERAERWNAVLLLDEADVYIRERGNDLNQNAIIGVFLRVLEYYKGVLFMTTNLGDVVEDAVASRCIARINYEIPSAADAKKIWRILSDVMSIRITDGTISQLVRKYNKLTGRDIKNLLKLFKLTQDPNRPKAVTVEAITFAKQFKPTK